ncbi:MAG: AAA family ATPase, partial [Myxococcota bacterium]
TDLRDFLNQAGLQAEAHTRRVSTYSKGMRQKVGIALALAKQAKALLLDEPTSGLDPSAAYEFSELLRSLSGRGVAVLMATHDLFRAKDVASRVGLMREGQIVVELGGDSLAQADLERLYLEHMRGKASPHTVSSVEAAP